MDRSETDFGINPEVKSARYTVALKRQIWKYEAVVQLGCFELRRRLDFGSICLILLRREALRRS